MIKRTKLIRVKMQVIRLVKTLKSNIIQSKFRAKEKKKNPKMRIVKKRQTIFLDL